LALPYAGSRSPHVERTFGWKVRWRRLVRDYEVRLDVSEAFIRVALGGLLLRRICTETILKRALRAVGRSLLRFEVGHLASNA
jgi:hypothetical protein